MFRKTALILSVSLTVLATVGCKPTYIDTPPKPVKTKVVKQQPITVHQAIKNSVNKYSKMYDIDKGLILAVIKTESNFNPYAKSKSGCMGLMQLAPRTFKARGVGNNIYDIDQNIHAGTKHLRGLKDRYNGDEDLMLAAYLLGGSNVKTSVPASAKSYVNKVKQYRVLF